MPKIHEPSLCQYVCFTPQQRCDHQKMIYLQLSNSHYSKYVFQADFLFLIVGRSERHIYLKHQPTFAICTCCCSEAAWNIETSQLWWGGDDGKEKNRGVNGEEKFYPLKLSVLWWLCRPVCFNLESPTPQHLRSHDELLHDFSPGFSLIKIPELSI